MSPHPLAALSRQSLTESQPPSVISQNEKRNGPFYGQTKGMTFKSFVSPVRVYEPNPTHLFFTGRNVPSLKPTGQASDIKAPEMVVLGPGGGASTKNGQKLDRGLGRGQRAQPFSWESFVEQEISKDRLFTLALDES